MRASVNQGCSASYEAMQAVHVIVSRHQCPSDAERCIDGSDGGYGGNDVRKENEMSVL